MDNLAPNSLDWALAHVKRYGDTDLFPIPFEFSALGTSWQWIRDDLSSRDLSQYAIGPIRRLLVPKPVGGFRVATQLDPLDSLVYTALVFEAAATVEKARVPADRKIACSYRIELKADGSFFRADNGWPDFRDRTRQLVDSGEYSHVVVADISDFYNQIYHHRLENALTTAGISEERAKSISGFISQLTATQSRGIPVGPHASIVLAEACMNDVDAFLLRKGHPFLRYVDDFRVFCTSERQAVRALHDLSEYLYTAHRLALEPAKSRILSTSDFAATAVPDPETEEEDGKVRKLAEIAADLGQESWYGVVEPVELDPEVVSKAVRDNIRGLFEDCLAAQPLHLGLAKHLLRRGAQLRTNVLVEAVFEGLELLAPVLRDVALYLRSALRKEHDAALTAKMTAFLQTGSLADIPYVHLWALEMLRENRGLRDPDTILDLTERYQVTVGVRQAALVAAELRLQDWVRERKETWRNHSPWDARALIAAAVILPPDERRHWLAQVQGTSPGLTKALAQHFAQ